MRIICKDRKRGDPVGALKRDTILLNLATGAVPSHAVYAAVDEYLSQWSRYLIFDSPSPKRK